jgi:DNA-binding NarL/FixJ family response regulator
LLSISAASSWFNLNASQGHLRSRRSQSKSSRSDVLFTAGAVTLCVEYSGFAMNASVIENVSVIENAGLAILVDALPFRRAGLANILAQWVFTEGLTLKAISLEELRIAEFQNPQIYILNVGGDCMSDDRLVAALQCLRTRSPTIPVAVFSDSVDAAIVRFACSAGVDAYIPTNLEPPTALKALSFVISGGKFFPPESLFSSAPSVVREKSENSNGTLHLTQRQNDIIEALKFGHSNKIIARRLNIAEATVKIHIRQIMRKLGVQNRTQIALAMISSDVRGAGPLARAP